MKQWQLLGMVVWTFLIREMLKILQLKNSYRTHFFLLDIREATRSYSLTSECLSNPNWRVFKDFKDASEMHWKSVYSVNNFLFVANDIYTGHYNSTPVKTEAWFGPMNWCSGTLKELEIG